MSVNNSAGPGSIIGIYFRFSLTRRYFVCSHENRLDEAILMRTHNISFSIKKKKKITLNYPKSAAMGFCAKGLKKEFETAVVNKPSVFQPLKFYSLYTAITNMKLILQQIHDLNLLLPWYQTSASCL